MKAIYMKHEIYLKHKVYNKTKFHAKNRVKIAMHCFTIWLPLALKETEKSLVEMVDCPPRRRTMNDKDGSNL